MKRLIFLLSVIALMFGFLFVFARSRDVGATYHGYVWEKTSETPCNPKCGEQGATHEVTYTCVDGEGRGHNECKIDKVWDSCPQGWSVWFTEQCKRNGHWQFMDRPSHLVPETKTVTEDCRVSEEEIVACKPECEEGFYMTENGCEANRVPEPPKSTPNTDPSAYMCPNSKTNDLPLAFHIARRPTEADYRWFWPQGAVNNANLYFRELGETSWKHAVGNVAKGGEFQEVTVFFLKPLVGYEFGLQLTNGCSDGVISVVTDGPKETIYHFSYLEVK